MGDQPADPHGVHADAVHVGAAGAVERGAGRVRDRAAARPRAGRRRSARPYAGRCRRARRPCPGGAARRPRRTRRTGPPRRRSASSAARRSRSSGRSGRRCPGPRPSQPRSVASRSSSKPVVPTTAWMPWPTQNSRLSITTSGWVKSTTASAPAATRSSRESSASTRATSSRSSAASTAAAHLGADPATGPEHPHRDRCPGCSPHTHQPRPWRSGTPATPASARLAVCGPCRCRRFRPDPVGCRADGRPAVRPRARDRLRAGRRRRADLQQARDRQAVRHRPLGVRRGPHQAPQRRSTSRPAG